MKEQILKSLQAARRLAGKHKTLLRILYLPLTIVWLELMVHLSDGSAMKYAPVYTVFALSLGILFNSPGAVIKEKHKGAIVAIVSGIITVIYGAEYICKAILQTYYPASALGTAAENHLYQFIGIIIQTLLLSWWKLILMLLPFILVLVFKKKLYPKDHPAAEKPFRELAICLASFAALHILGLGAAHLPYSGDLNPAKLYGMDTNYNDQVEQLGLYSMVRLDMLHTMFPGTIAAEEFDPGTILGGNTEGEETTPGAIDAPEEVIIDRSPNIMNVDLAAIAENSSGKDVKWLANYFNSVTPTNKNEYTGMFKDYNVIFVTMEAFDYLAVSEEYTPTLYKMMHQGFDFTNFYSALHYTSTSNGECQNLLGLYPKNGNPITMARTGENQTNAYFSLAQQLGRLGYNNLGFHNNWNLYGRDKSHSNLGYLWNWSGTGISYQTDGAGNLKWPQSDCYLIEESLNRYDYMTSDQPFNIYYLTVSAHTPYSWNWVASHYKEELKDCPYSETTKAYIATIMEVDRAFEMLLEKLEAAGKLENTLIVAAPDHIPYTAVESINEMAGKNYGSSEAASNINEAQLDLDVYRNGLIIWSASMKEPVVVDKVCCQVDILPTVSNLLGLEYDSRMLSGSDILSDSEGLVVFSSRCWRSDKGFYSRFTGKFTPAEGVEMTEEETKEYVDRIKTLAGYKLDSTAKIVESNFFNVVFGSESKVAGKNGDKVSGTRYTSKPRPQRELDEIESAQRAEEERKAAEEAALKAAQEASESAVTSETAINQ